MTPNPLRSAGALAAAGVALVVMAIWGVQAATSPVDTGEPVAQGSDEPECAPEDQIVVKFIRRAEVTVSVFNTGKRSGRAQDTLSALERYDFRPGAVGNAEKGDKVARAEVRTTREDDPAAKLVALAFGPKTPVTVVDEDYGPGVDVFIGDKFNKLAKSAPRKVKLPEPEVSCA